MDENNIIQIINADDICRACLSEGELQPIFMTRIGDNSLTLSEMLMACASVQASEGDGLPSKMCSSCITQMNHAFSFKRHCEESDANLRLYLFNRISRISREQVKLDTDDIKEEIKLKDLHLEEKNDVDDENIVEYDKRHCEESDANLRFYLFNRISREQVKLDTDDIKEEIKLKDLHLEEKNDVDDENIVEYDKRHCEESDANLRLYIFNRISREQVKLDTDDIKEEIKLEDLHLEEKNDVDDENIVEYDKRHCEESDANLRLYLFNRISREQVKLDTDDIKEEIELKDLHLEERNDVDDENIVEYDKPSNLNEMSLNENISDNQENDAVVQITKLKKDEKKQRRTNGVTKNNNECQNCNLQFETRAEYLDHVKNIKHQRRLYPCSMCNKKFPGYRLKEHMRTHTKEKPFSCEVCGFKFSLDCNLRRHMKVHTGERPHKCNVCGKGFIQSTSLTEHLRMHTGEMPYICNTCGKKFRHSRQFHFHVRKHDLKDGENKPVKHDENDQLRTCKICNKLFSSNEVMKTHMLIHGPKRFLCSDCGKDFSTKQGLQSHMKVHTGEKPYPCQTCGKSFSQVGLLKAHQLIHTGEKPYICGVCDKSFTQRNHLKYHVRIHSGEKPYTCSVCNKSFSLNGTLTVHMRIHTGETPYLCPVCGKGFYDSSSMKKHLKKHNIEDNLKVECKKNSKI